MARRKGSSRGKTTVNSRKLALENAREKLRDDPGGTADLQLDLQQQPKDQDLLSNLSNMEATTTTQTTATTNTKYYNKTKLQNNHQQPIKTSTTALASTITNKKQTYRELEKTSETQMVETTAATTTATQQKKLTAKQAKAAAKQLQQQQNAKCDTNLQQQQQQQQQQKESVKKIILEKDAKQNVKTIPATTSTVTATAAAATATVAPHTEQTVIAETTTATTFKHNNSLSSSSSSKNNSNNNKNSSNANTRSDNHVNCSISINSSSSSSISSISIIDQQQKQERMEKNSNSQSDKQLQQQPISTDNSNVYSSSSSPSINWNNSKYLHKKFKRLASTTENDAAQEAEKMRSTSLSSASSSVSSPPPPPQQPSASNLTVAVSSSSTMLQQENLTAIHCSSASTLQEDNFKNGNVINKNDTTTDTTPITIQSTPNARNSKNEQLSNNNNNKNLQNQVLLQLAQQQQQQLQLQQQSVATESVNSSSTSNINNLNHITVSTTSATTTAGSGSGSGRCYICPYCNLSCTKPSVLQKHIRAHTNERPYPCDICGIAFKTKSNLYKHCRSRSHAARQKGIEVPPDADDGLSDQDVDPELSNSSSEMLSRNSTPTEEIVNTHQYQHQQQHQQQLPSQILLTATTTASPMSSTSPALTTANTGKTTYLQQPLQQQIQQLPLGSPAAGTLPPATAIMATNSSTSTTSQNIALDYKPYKPKFHNAALYATPKEAAAAAAAAAAVAAATKGEGSVGENPTTLTASTTTKKESVSIQKLSESTTPTVSQQLHHQQQQQQQQQHVVAVNECKMFAPSIVHLPTQQAPPLLTSHHPSLSPSTQMKLNNHINSHQLQQLQQQQHIHQLQTQATHHLLASPHSNALQLPLAAAYYISQSPGATGALLHPSAHIPGPQAFYSPVFAPLHLMTPQQQQQFHHQLQIQQQQIQQQQLQLQQQQQQQQQQQHSNATASSIVPPSQSPHSSQPSPSLVGQTHSKNNSNANNANSMTSNTTRTVVHHPKPIASSNCTIQPNPLHFLASAASAASTYEPPTITSNINNNNKANKESAEQSSNVISQRSAHVVSNTNTSNLLQTTANSGNQEVTLNKEKLHEHINKIISQNEAIVENKELLLQKKYPKTLNRSRSFTTNNNSTISSTNSAGGSQTLQSTTGAPPSESATNAKLAQAIVQKQLQQQQQQQQQLQQQQQQHQQYMYQQQQQQQQQQQHQLQLNKQRTLYSNEKANLEESSLPLNGISKHLMSNKLIIQQTVPQVTTTLQVAAPTTPTNQVIYQQYRSLVTNTPAQHTISSSSPSAPVQNSNSTITNVPLNLSSKSKSVEERPPPGPLPQAPPSATPRKRHSIEQPCIAVNDASNSSNSNSSTPQPQPQPSTSTGKYPPNNSIIKNLLLNARGLAVPKGSGEDAVYICPLCSMEFRTAEDLQLHNSTYCQGSNSSANSPASSPSHKYFRSNSVSLNMPDLKMLSKNPLSLVKLAWSQLQTKPSNLVLNRLSASVAKSTKSSSTTTTSATSTQPSSTATNSSLALTSAISATTLTVTSQTKTQLTVNEIPLRFVDAPLPSPGPLLGKTPLVDYSSNESKSKSEEVIITKMHDHDGLFNHNNNVSDPTASKRMKFDLNVKSSSSSKRSSLTSGGDMQLLNAQEMSKREERLKRFTSSGGCMIPLSECDDVDKSPKMIRTPLLSGGSFQEVSPKKENKLPLTILPGGNHQLTPKLSLGLVSSSSNAPQHFQFPPINQITAFNPLTLGLTEKVIPNVPGMPGPNSLQPQLPLAPPTKPSQPQQQQQHLLSLPQNPNQLGSRTSSPIRKQSTSPMNMTTNNNSSTTAFGGVQNVPSEFNRAPPSTNMRNVRNWPTASGTGNSNTQPGNKTTATVTESSKSLKSFNFMRMADNLSPRKNSNTGESETRHFNLDKMSREQLIIQQPSNNTKSVSPVGTVSSTALSPLHVDTNVMVVSTENDSTVLETKTKSKFLRPTSLPLRPGTFTPKRHHGITPTANTLPLISPETPRPSKECVQLYLNGNSYTYLGLKSTTKTFYCTLNCPQPSYVQDMHKLSMYSMWQQCAENNPHPLGLKPKEVMSLYDSRQKLVVFTIAQDKKLAYTLVAAQQTVMTPFISTQDKFYHHQLKPIALKEALSTKDNSKLASAETADSSKDNTNSTTAASSTSAQVLEGGYESHENYIYVRGRGRGKYVCSECGIRCKKPSMLKKHIRTHTDVRPYTCKHCNFSFKTKGNLTKHMQSKTHYKKCIELGLNPGPMPADSDFLEPDVEFDQQSSTSAGDRNSSMGNGESDSDGGDSTDNETESSNESDSVKSSVTQSLNMTTVTSAAEDNKSHLEHEAARCLLTLSMTPPIHTQSLETSIASSQITGITNTSTIIASSTATPVAAIRRVISYTSPKPPFDYHKQEQYYSNPKEHKYNLGSTSTTNFESAPIDLTKPRAMETKTINSTQGVLSTASSSAGPLQTQAQIRDVIFGVNKNESGFLKTMISVSSKVGRNYNDNYEENHHKLNEDMMLYDYRREQTLQYYKIKQTQLSRGMTVNPNITISVSTPTTTSTAASSSVVSQATMEAMTTVSSSATTAITSCSINNESLPTNTIKKDVITPMQLPKIEIVEPKETKSKAEVDVTIAVTTPGEIITALAKPPLKSSDESEETDEEPPAKKSLTKKEEKPSHNSNLPAAILQPGTTDFSGVLSGGSTSTQSSNSSSNQPTRTVIVGEDGFTTNNNEILPVHPRVPQITNADGRPVCSICSKTFQKQSQLVLHMNIHYMERKYKCDPCAVSFRTQGHLQKHERSDGHKNKVIMTSTFGVPTTSNPRPFECTDCKIAFRIHGHLAKHLRSKTHVQKLECLQKLPFGTYAEIERAGISLTEIDTSDCENSLISLRVLAQKLIDKDPSSKLGSYTTPSGENSNTGLVSQDSASEDGFTAAERAAATAIASLDNNSAANTPRRTNSTSEDESFALSLNNNLKRRLPGSFSNGEESDKEYQDQQQQLQLQQEKRLRTDLTINTNSTTTSSPTN